MRGESLLGWDHLSGWNSTHTTFATLGSASGLLPGTFISSLLCWFPDSWVSGLILPVRGPLNTEWTVTLCPLGSSRDLA